MQAICDALLFLIIYSFLGWACETAYCSFGEGKFVNRGFLNGPFCPIYGFGSLLVLQGLQYFTKSPIWIFLGGMLITSTLEYVTSWLMEKLFHAKWWDYTERKFNINGRVCLLNSTLFGILCLILQFYVHPFVSKIIMPYSIDFKMGFLAAFAIYFIADMAVTLKSVLNLNSRINVIGKIKQDLLEKYNEIDNKLGLSKLQEELAAHNSAESAAKLHEKLKSNIFERRLLKAFPQIKSQLNDEILSELMQLNIHRKRK